MRLKQLEPPARSLQKPDGLAARVLPRSLARPHPSTPKTRSVTSRKRTTKTRSVLLSDEPQVTSPPLQERRLPPLTGEEEELVRARGAGDEASDRAQVQRLSVPKRRSNIDMGNVVMLGGRGGGGGSGERFHLL